MSKKNKRNGHQTETPDVTHIRNVDVGYEHSDINVPGALTFAAVLTIGIVAVCVGMWVLFGYFRTQEEKEPAPGPMALSKQERLPPGPRLQAAPGFGLTLENGKTVNLELREPQAEYQELRKQWMQALHDGPRDQSGNMAGMPIDDAIKKIVSDGSLPVRSKDAPSKLAEYAVSLPTAASSGRVTEKRVQ